METSPYPKAVPLTEYSMFEGEDVDDARETLSTLFTDISLEPDQGWAIQVIFSHTPARSSIFGMPCHRN